MKIHLLIKIIIIYSSFCIFATLKSFAQDTKNQANESDGSKKSQSYTININKINPSNFYKEAVIQALDKSTAKKTILNIKVDQEEKFDNIAIKVHRCWQAPLQQTPESKALIEVIEKIKYSYEVQENNLFFGWIFASSPSVSGLEHPIYDLTLLNCKN